MSDRLCECNNCPTCAVDWLESRSLATLRERGSIYIRPMFSLMDDIELGGYNSRCPPTKDGYCYLRDSFESEKTFSYWASYYSKGEYIGPIPAVREEMCYAGIRQEHQEYWDW